MRVKLPIIGLIATGKDIQEPAIPKVTTIDVPKTKSNILGSFLDLGSKSLSGEKSVSAKLIESFYEWVFINVTTLSEEISKLEPELYQIILRGGEYQMVEVETHPILDLLDRFNESTTQSDAFYLTEAHLDLVGDSFWYLEGGANGAQPTNIYLLQPDKVSLKLGDVYSGATRLIAGYNYKTTVDGKIIQVDYEPEEILPIKVPNPKNPYRGFSVVEGIANTLDIDSNTLTATRSFYENGMMSQFMLTTDNKITDDQLKRLKAEMRAAYSGSKNFWKVPIFGGGIKPETVQMSGRDAQIIEQQAWTRDKIMAAFKNTKASLGITEDVNRANAEATLLSWKQSTIKPKMCRIVDALNEHLVPRYGDNLILGFKDPVPEDASKKNVEAISLLNSGIISINEARDMIGMDSTTGGDDVVSTREVPNEVPKSVKNVNYKQVLRRNGFYTRFKNHKAQYQKALENARPIARQIIKKELPVVVEAKVVHPDFTNDNIQDFQAKQLEFVDRIEAQFEDKLKSYLDVLANKVVGNLHQHLPTKQVKNKTLFNEAEELGIIQNELRPTLVALASASSNHANSLIGVNSPFVPDEKVYSYIHRQINKFADSMFATDKDYLARLIANGVANGDSIAVISRSIESNFKNTFTRIQAERTTRTEILRESNHFMTEQWIESGVVESKQWLLSGDPCEVCLAIEAEYGTRDLTENFASLGDVIEYQNDKGEQKTYTIDYSDLEEPPAHPNCRCTVIPVLKSLKAFDTSSYGRIKELENKIDKRTKAYRKIKQAKSEQDVYIKELEKLAGLGNE